MTGFIRQTHKTKALFFLIIFFFGYKQSYIAQQRYEIKSIIYNSLVGSVTGGVGALINKKPDEKWGEVAAAFVELRVGATASEAEIIAHCRAEMARFKVPKQVIFGVLPKTSTGKIQKFVLREQLHSAAAIV